MLEFKVRRDLGEAEQRLLWAVVEEACFLCSIMDWARCSALNWWGLEIGLAADRTAGEVMALAAEAMMFFF